MYRLFVRIPKGLEPIAAIFRQHVCDEGTALVKQAEDAVSSRKVGGGAGQAHCTALRCVGGWVPRTVLHCTV